MTDTELIALAERVEKAVYPANTDAEAAELVEIQKDICDLMHRDCDAYSPDYIGSLDAAMSLMPEGWRVGEMGETVIECDDPWQVTLLEKRFSGERAKCAQGDAATPALALCAASLRARANERGE